MIRALLVALVLVLLAAAARAQFAPQTWTAPQNTGGFCVAPTSTVASVMQAQSDGSVICSSIPSGQIGYGGPFGGLTSSPILTFTGVEVDVHVGAAGDAGFLAENTSSGPSDGAQFSLINDSTNVFGIRYQSVAAGDQVLWIGPGGGQGSIFLDQLGVGFAIAAKATNATTGFLQVETCPGTPTGVPSVLTGQAPVVYDNANGILYCYNGGWSPCDPAGSGTVTGVFGTPGRIAVTPASPNPAVDLATFGTASTCAWANVVTDAWGRTACTANSAPQPAGNYITALSHDVIATGPGSAAAEVVGITDGTSIDHQVAASAWTNGQALALDGSGDIHTTPFQVPLTGCTDYVSVSCQGGTSDIGTSGSNSAVQIDAFHDAGGQRWTYGTLADGEFARFDVGGGKFVAASTIAGDGTSITTSNSGIPPENLVIAATGKVKVSATDPTFDYLDTKFESTTGNISVSHIVGPPEFVNLNVIMGGNTPQTMFWSWKLNTSTALNDQFLCEGNYNVGTETCSEYPALQSFSHVSWTLNITNNSCTGVGSPTFTLDVTKNGATLTSTTVACGTTGVVSVGTASFSASAGDTIGLVYDGRLFGTGLGGGTSGFVTTRFDP